MINLKAGKREWIALTVMILPCVLYTIDLAVLYLTVPRLSTELKPSSAELLWIVDIRNLMIAGFLITMGTLGDRIGRRRLLLIGAGMFSLASMFAAFSTSALMLIAARALLGVAAATFVPSTLSLIRNIFHDSQQRIVAIGLWSIGFPLGGIIGRLLGGMLLDRFWWGSVFLINVPVMLLFLAIGPKLLPEFRNPGASRLDIASVLISIGATLAVIYGLKRVAETGLAWLPVSFILVGLAIGFVFVRRQQRLADPLIDIRLFHIPAFRTALTANTLSAFVAFGSLFFVVQYLQLVLGLPPLQAGLWTIPEAIGFMVGFTVAPMIARHIRPVYIMAGGLALAALSFGLLALGLFAHGTYGLAIVVIATTIMSLGLSSTDVVGIDIIVATVRPERSGAASAISGTGTEFGGALGIAILGSIGTAVYGTQMANAIPAGIPPLAAEAARGTLGGAMAVGKQFPDLVKPARDAFIQAMQISVSVSGVIALMMAIVVIVVLGRIPAASSKQQ